MIFRRSAGETAYCVDTDLCRKLIQHEILRAISHMRRTPYRGQKPYAGRTLRP